MDYEQGYEHVFSDLVRRGTNRQDKFVEYFNSKVAPGRTFTNILSIGPGECGNELQLLQTSLSGVKSVYLIEADTQLHQTGRDKLRKKFGDKFEICAFNQIIEDYEHKGDKLDIIFISNVLYHRDPFKNFSQIIGKVKNWLAPGGFILNNHVYHPLYLNLQPISVHEYEGLDPEKLGRVMEGHGLKCEVGWADYTFDTSDGEATGWAFLEILTGKPVSQKEIDFMKEAYKDITDKDGMIQAKQYIQIASV